MKKFKNDTIKIIIGGIVVFLLGFSGGYYYKSNKINSIQGYSYDLVSGLTSLDDATNANATNANATNANATNANATNANATNANATNANASFNDNIIFLQKFELKKTVASVGDKINVNILTSGACNSAATIVFKNNNGITFTAKVENIANDPYIVIPSNALSSKYNITDLLLVGKNSDGTTFTKQYSTNGFNKYDFNTDLVIENPKEEKSDDSKNKSTDEKDKDNTVKATKIKLENITLKSKFANVGEKVYFVVSTSEKVNNIIIMFKSSDNKKFTVYAKDLEILNPYFEIPSSTETGKYSLYSVTLISETKSVVYTKNGEDGTEKYKFNEILEIKEPVLETYIYNNEDLDSEIISKLHTVSDDIDITINANANTIINEELFNVIKGKNKNLIINNNNNQIIFNGVNIINSKTIDVAMSVNKLSSNEKINNLVSDGIIVNFSDNGNLPGKALVRFKTLNEYEINDDSYIYLYNESSDNFTLVDAKVRKSTDDYYEFEISHNSSYLITNKKLDNSLIATNNSNIVNFQKGNSVHFLLILVGAIVILIVLISILLINLKKNKKIK